MRYKLLRIAQGTAGIWLGVMGAVLFGDAIHGDIWPLRRREWP